MNTYQNISAELKAYFSNHPIFKVLLPLDMAFVFGGAGIIALSKIMNVGMLYAIAYYALFFGLLLAYANMHEKFMYISLFIYAGASAWSVLYYGLFNKYYKTLDFYALLTCVIFGWLGYIIFKKHTLHGSGTQL